VEHSEEHHEPLGYGVYVIVWLGLLVLTGLTVAIAGINLHSNFITVSVALGIAVIKTFFVVSYFMHVKYDARIFKLLILASLVTFMIIITLTFMDISVRSVGTSL